MLHSRAHDYDYMPAAACKCACCHSGVPADATRALMVYKLGLTYQAVHARAVAGMSRAMRSCAACKRIARRSVGWRTQLCLRWADTCAWPGRRSGAAHARQRAGARCAGLLLGGLQRAPGPRRGSLDPFE